MGDSEKPSVDPPDHKEPDSKESLLSIDLEGRDIQIWEKRRPRFHERLVNSVKMLFGKDIPPSATANEDLKKAIDTMGDSAIEALKAPQLKNLERQASVRVMLAEAREREAQARKIEIETEMMELELDRERRKVHESQQIIERLIQRGELVMLERDGETVLIYKESPDNEKV